MNLPNKLTVCRVALVPIFVAFFLINSIPYNYMLALVVFVVASITDFFDGYIARKNNLVTDFGKFLDPLADKVLVISAMLCFIDVGFCSSVPVIIVITREFMVTSLRLISASQNGNVISASMVGKVKTVVQMVVVILILLLCAINELGFAINVVSISGVLMWVTSIVTLLSGVEYMYQNRDCIKTK